jgi:hypothetical protein
MGLLPLERLCGFFESENHDTSQLTLLFVVLGRQLPLGSLRCQPNPKQLYYICTTAQPSPKFAYGTDRRVYRR